MNFTMYSTFSQTVIEKGWEIAADIAKNYGCSSIELIETTYPTEPDVFNSLDDVKHARKALESRGLSAACYSVYADVYKAPKNVEYLKKRAEYACELGSPFLHHTLLPWIGQSENQPPYEEAIEIATDAAEEIAKHAAKFGITCIYEDQGNYVNGIEGYRTFYNELKRRCPNVAVCGDVGNSIFVDVPGEDFFSAFADDIVHVHIKDYHRKNCIDSPGRGWYKTKGGAWVHDSNVGDGVVNLEACIKILKEVGYTGAIAIESTDIPEAISYIKSLL